MTQEINAKFSELEDTLGHDVELNCKVADGDALYSVYEHGSIFWNPHKSEAYFVHKHIWDKWLSVYRTQSIGLLISDSELTEDDEGYYSDCESGSVIWSHKTGAHAVCSDIKDKWVSIGGYSALGYPVSDEQLTEDKYFNVFEGGTIYVTRGREDGASFRVSLDGQFDHCLEKPFSDPSNIDTWWGHFRPTTVLRDYKDDNLPLRVFDLRHFCQFRRIRFVAPTDWDMFVVVSHTWKENVPEWYGPKRPWPSDKYMRYWGFSEDDLYLAAKVLVALGNTYCWIDNICIDQDSEEEKSREINRMGSFFGNPSTCYIFPHGIGEISGVTQEAPRWYSRVWTMQEILLSNNPIHIYISRSTIGVGDVIECELANGLVATKVRHDNIYEFYKGEPYTDIIWGRKEPTKLEILRCAGCRKSTKVEDKIYGILALLNVKNVDIRYGGGLKEAIVLVANAVHVDQRIIMCVVEWAGSEWADGYCAIPTMSPGLQAWDIDVDQTVGQAYFMGDRGMEVTSFISPAMRISASSNRIVWKGRDGNDYSNVSLGRGHKCNLIKMKIGQSVTTNSLHQPPSRPGYSETVTTYEPFYNYAGDYTPGSYKSDILVTIGFGTLAKSHNNDALSKLIIVGRSRNMASIVDQVPNDGPDCEQSVVAVICQQAGDVYHKTGICIMDVVSSFEWAIGRTILA